MLDESRVSLLLHSYLIDVIVQDDVLKGIVVANKSGMQVIMGDIFIDATGDADLAAMAGIPFEQTDIEVINPVTLEFRVGGVNGDKVIEYIEEHPDQFELVVSARKLSAQRCFDLPLHSFPGLETAIKQGKLPPDLTSKQIWFNTHEPEIDRGIFTFNATRVKEINARDVKHLTYAEMKARKQIIPLIQFLRENFPGFENAYLLDIAPQMGVRETRRIVGEYTITKEDVLQGRKKEDVIAKIIKAENVDETSMYRANYNNTALYKSSVEIFSGKLKWKYEITHNNYKVDFSSPAISNGKVIIGSGNTFLVALNIETGKLEWEFKAEDSIFSSPIVDDGIVYTCSFYRGMGFDSKLYAFDAKTGIVKWKTRDKMFLSSSPIICNNNIYILG